MIKSLRSLNSAAVASLGVLSLLLGYLISWKPLVASSAIIICICVILLTRPSGRMFFVTAGSLITLQSPNVSIKLAFVAGLGLSLILSVPSISRSLREGRLPRQYLTFLLTSVAVVLICVVSYFLATDFGTSFQSWFSSVLPYILLAVLPWIGIDAGLNAGKRSISAILLVVVIVAPLAFMTDWLDRRGVSALGFGRFAYASIPLIVVGLAWSIVRAARGRHLISIWILPVALLPLSVLITGTRSAFAMVGGLLGLLGRRSRGSVSLWRTVGLLALTVTLAYLLFAPIALAVTGGNSEFFARRFGSLFSSGVGNDDASLLGRTYQTTVALNVWQSHPLLGVGPGLTVPGVTTFDTPVAPLAYFGIIGILVIIAYLAALAICCRQTPAGDPGISRLVGRVFSMSVLTYLPLSSVLDDKGFSLATALLCLLVTRDLRVMEESAAANKSLVSKLPTLAEERVRVRH